MKKTIILMMLVAVALASCKQTDAQEKAMGLLKQAQQQYEEGQFDAALASIDSLRRVYPNAIEVRQRALTLYQDVCLKQAQQNVERMDAELQELKTDYNTQKKMAELHHSEGTATEEELMRVNMLRLKRDSLQTRFDTECAKVKLIRQKQKEG
jgi:hypothetical protein